MKHKSKITLILICMFVITQLIGLYVVGFYSPVKVVNGEPIKITAPPLPYGLQTPSPETTGEFNQAFLTIAFAFVVAISLLLFLTKLNAEIFLKIWFFSVITIALGVSLNTFIPEFNYKIFLISVAALSLAFVKIFKREFLTHNLTELLIYPGIAAVFVPILNIYTISALLVLISVYDIWAVWHSGLMQKMAKYQINKLNIFSGFFIPYTSKNAKIKLQKIKAMKSEKLKKEKLKKLRINVAILGGGDVVFPIIAAGVVLKTLGFYPALLVSAGATLGLTYLLIFSEKKKFYPAMPFISAGIFAGILLGYLLWLS